MDPAMTFDHLVVQIALAVANRFRPIRRAVAMDIDINLDAINLGAININADAMDINLDFNVDAMDLT